jgi:hypothetical protein
MRTSLAERCCERGMEAIRIADFDTNELYYVDRQGRWQETTPDEISNKISRDGEANIVLKCTTETMNGPDKSVELDAGYQEFDGVKDFYCSDGNLIIETEHEFLCNEDISLEIDEYQQTHDMVRSDYGDMDPKEEFERNWEGDMDYHEWSLEPENDIMNEVDFEFELDM